MSQTSNMKRLLREQDLLAEDGRLFWLAKPEELLQEWTRVYSYEVNDVRELYSMLSTGEAEEKIAEECERRSIRYGLALFSGADRVAPRTRYNRTFAFVDAEQDEVAGLLSMKPVPSGANVVLMRPYDDGVFYGLQEMQGAKVVSDIQLYLDLKSYRGRGNEAADFLFETRIEPRWRQQRNHTTTPTP